MSASQIKKIQPVVEKKIQPVVQLIKAPSFKQQATLDNGSGIM